MGFLSGLFGHSKTGASTGRGAHFTEASRASTSAPLKAPAATQGKPLLLRWLFGSTPARKKDFEIIQRVSQDADAAPLSAASGAAARPVATGDVATPESDRTPAKVSSLSNVDMDQALARARVGNNGASTSGAINKLLSKAKKAPLFFFSAKTVEYHQKPSEGSAPLQVTVEKNGDKESVSLFKIDSSRENLLKPMQGRRELARGQTLEQLQEDALAALSKAMKGAEMEKANEATRAVADPNIGDYVKACLGLQPRPLFVNETFEKLAYQLSKNASLLGVAKQPVTRSSVQLLAALYVHRMGGENAFKKEAGPQPDIGSKFYQFVARHAGLTENEVRAAIKPEYLHEIKLIPEKNGRPRVQIFGKGRPLSDFNIDTEQTLQQSRDEGARQIELIMEGVYRPAPLERADTPAVGQVRSNESEAAVVMIDPLDPRSIREHQNTLDQALKAKVLLQIDTTHHVGDTYPYPEVLERVWEEASKTEQGKIERNLHASALGLLSELNFALAVRARSGLSEGGDIETVLGPFFDARQALDWLTIAFKRTLSVGMVRQARYLCEAICASAENLSREECGSLEGVLNALDPALSPSPHGVQFESFSRSRARALAQLEARQEARGKETLTDDDLAADDMQVVRAWALEEARVADAVLKLSDSNDLKTYPSAELRRNVYQLPEKELKLFLAKLSADQLAALLADDPSGRVLSSEEEKSNAAKKRIIEQNLQSCALNLLSELGSEVREMAGPEDEEEEEPRDGDGIGGALAPYRIGDQNLGWLTVAAARLPSLDDPELTINLLARAHNLIEALGENVEKLSGEDAWQMVEMLDALEPLDRASAGEEEGESFGKRRLAAMEMLSAHYETKAREAAGDGDTVISVSGVYTPETHKEIFEQINAALSVTLTSDPKTAVFVNAKLPDGSRLDDVAIPHNFFGEAPGMLAAESDAVLFDGSNMGAFIGLRDRSLEGRKVKGVLPDPLGQTAGADTRAINLLLNTLTPFCRTEDELMNLSGLLTQTSGNMANKAYQEVVRNLIQNPIDPEETDGRVIQAKLQTNNRAMSAIIFEGKRLRIRRNDEGSLEVRVIGNVRFENPNLDRSSASEKNPAPPPFDAELSRGLCVPVFVISDDGREVQLARVEHYSVFTKHAAPASRLNLA